MGSAMTGSVELAFIVILILTRDIRPMQHQASGPCLDVSWHGKLAGAGGGGSSASTAFFRA
jgi:hypothetical protein